MKSITLSDHAPVVVSLELKDIPDRQRSWRLDESLLHDQAIVEDLEGELSLFFIENNEENIAPTVLWEAYKVFMRGILIAEGAKRKKIWIAQKQLLLQEIQELE